MIEPESSNTQHGSAGGAQEGASGAPPAGTTSQGQAGAKETPAVPAGGKEAPPREPGETKAEYRVRVGDVMYPVETKEDYDYLASLGAETYLERKKAEEKARDAKGGEKAPKDAKGPTSREGGEAGDSAEDPLAMTVKELAAEVADLKGKLSAKEQADATRAVQEEVDKAISQDEFLSALDEKHRTRAKRAILQDMLMGRKSSKDATDAYSKELAEITGEERRKYISGKIKATQEASPSGGGSEPPPARKYTVKDLKDGVVRRALKERLSRK